jgi:hypothetical protein
MSKSDRDLLSPMKHQEEDDFFTPSNLESIPTFEKMMEEQGSDFGRFQGYVLIVIVLA